MSTDDDSQTMITQYQTADETAVEPAQDTQTETKPNWLDCEESLKTKQQCQNCGADVTEDYRLVFGDTDDRAHACKECQTWTAIKAGAAADPDFERRVGEVFHR